MALTVDSKLKDLLANEETRAVLEGNGLPVDKLSNAGDMKLSGFAKVAKFPPALVDKLAGEILASYRDFTKVIQIGMIVKDAQKAVDEFCSLFPVPDNKRSIAKNLGDSLSITYKGEAKYCQLACGLINYRHVQFEFIQPLDDEFNFYTDALANCTGIHHVCVACKDTPAAIAAMKAAGVELVSEGNLYGSEVAFFKMANSNLLLELCDASGENSSEIELGAGTK